MAECQTVGEAGASSTKVRSVELRNLYRVKFNDAGEIPQRRCEAWSFAMWTTTPCGPRSSILNEGAKRGASQCRIAVRLLVSVPSSTKVRSVELRNVVDRLVAGTVDQSSTKVRSVELRNQGFSNIRLSYASPQRRCEAWSFAIRTSCAPPPACPFLNEGAKRGASQSAGDCQVMLHLHQSSTKVRSVELRNWPLGCPKRSGLILNEGAKRGASQWVVDRLVAGTVDQSSTKVRSVELRNHAHHQF